MVSRKAQALRRPQKDKKIIQASRHKRMRNVGTGKEQRRKSGWALVIVANEMFSNGAQETITNVQRRTCSEHTGGILPKPASRGKQLSIGN